MRASLPLDETLFSTEIGEKMLKRSWLYDALCFNIFLLVLLGFTPHVSAQEDTFSFDDFSFTLPEGWVKQDIPGNSEKELIGSLKAENIPGTSILIFRYKDGRYNYSSVRIIGLKTIASVFPKGQEMLKKGMKVETEGGLTGVVELWRGAADVSGTAVFLQAPMGIVETKAGWILMLGFTPDATGTQLQEAFLKMIQSARYESPSHGSPAYRIGYFNSVTGDSSAQR